MISSGDGETADVVTFDSGSSIHAAPDWDVDLFFYKADSENIGHVRNSLGHTHAQVNLTDEQDRLKINVDPNLPGHLLHFVHEEGRDDYGRKLVTHSYFLSPEPEFPNDVIQMQHP